MAWCDTALQIALVSFPELHTKKNNPDLFYRVHDVPQSAALLGYMYLKLT